MGLPKTVKRSACDRCRAKRVRCPRAEDSLEPCARCIRAAAACVTGAAGNPGRPRKTIGVDGTPTPRSVTADHVSSPGCWITPRDGDDLELRTPAVGEPIPGNTEPARTVGTERSLNLVVESPRVAGHSKPTTRPQTGGTLPTGSPDPWLAHSGGGFFDFPLSEYSFASNSIPTLQQQLSTVPNHQELLGGVDGNLDTPYYASQQCNNDVYGLGPFDLPEYQPDPISGKYPSATSSLMRFRENMERRVSTMGAFLSNSRNTVEDCADDPANMPIDNPVATAILCTKEFVEIIQTLMAPTRSRASSPSSFNQIVSPPESLAIQPESLDTETLLMVLSSYLQLMKLYDSLFREGYRSLCEIPSETIKSIKVKAVIRIGGISSLQDMPGKAYAKGIVEVIQSHIQTLERCLGIPATYCLTNELANPAPDGVFANADRARLLQAVMTQEDVRSPGGNGPYVESIRDNMKSLLALFAD